MLKIHFITNRVCALLIRHVAHITAEKPVGKEKSTQAISRYFVNVLFPKRKVTIRLYELTNNCKKIQRTFQYVGNSHLNPIICHAKIHENTLPFHVN